MGLYDLTCILKESLSTLLKKQNTKQNKTVDIRSRCRIKELFQETTATVQARGSEKSGSDRGGEKFGTLNIF